MAKHHTGATMIALRQQTVAGHDFLPGDLFKIEGISDRKISQMIGTRYIGTLTRDSYAASMKRRAPGTVGAGFTRDGLMAMGIISDADPEPAAAEGEWAPDATEYPAVQELYEGFWIAGKKIANFTRCDIYDLKGARLNPGGALASVKQAKAFVDKIVETAKAEAEKAAAAEAENPGGSATETLEDAITGAAGAPALDAMTDEELREMLVGAGLEPTGNESREDLLELVKILPVEKVLFADHPESLDDWTDEHHAAFDEWFDGLAEDATAYRLTPAAGLRFSQKRGDGGAEQEGGAGTDDSNIQSGADDGQG